MEKGVEFESFLPKAMAAVDAVASLETMVVGGGGGGGAVLKRRKKEREERERGGCE
jgi:hypothetical protein